LTSPTTGIRVNQEPAITTMKRITSVAMALTALFGLAVSGCDKKTSEDLEQKAEETKQTVERSAKEAKDATQDAIEKTKEAADSAAEKLKEAVGASPTPTP
jgi:gas vesicle protein